jgi:TMEM175 potassium channel family protein
MLKELEKSELTQSLIELEARDKSRLETFVDAVFAIAITLLGLGLVVPIVQHSNVALSTALVGMGAKFVGYFLAFALLGILLNSHWRQFQDIVYADWVLYFINILFLSFVVLVPFATTVWTNYPDTTSGVMFFHVVMFITGLTLYANWSYVRRRNYLLKKGITVRTLKPSHSETRACPSRQLLRLSLRLSRHRSAMRHTYSSSS